MPDPDTGPYDPNALKVDLNGNPVDRNPYFPDPNDHTLNGDRVLYHLAFGAKPEDFHPAVQSLAQTYGLLFPDPQPKGPGLLGSLENIRKAIGGVSTGDMSQASEGGQTSDPVVPNPSASPMSLDATLPHLDIQPARSKTSFDSAKAAQYMREHALPKWSGQCARFVRRGLTAGGLNVAGRPKYAKDYGPFLEGLGATIVDPEHYQPQQGDVVVYKGNGKHTSGHVQIYDGSQWISDFKQKHFSPYSSDIPPNTIYRFGGQ